MVEVEAEVEVEGEGEVELGGPWSCVSPSPPDMVCIGRGGAIGGVVVATACSEGGGGGGGGCTAVGMVASVFLFLSSYRSLCFLLTHSALCAFRPAVHCLTQILASTLSLGGSI